MTTTEAKVCTCSRDDVELDAQTGRCLRCGKLLRDSFAGAVSAGVRNQGAPARSPSQAYRAPAVPAPTLDRPLPLPTLQTGVSPGPQKEPIAEERRKAVLAEPRAARAPLPADHPAAPFNPAKSIAALTHKARCRCGGVTVFLLNDAFPPATVWTCAFCGELVTL